MDTWLVQVLVMSQRYKPVIRQEQVLYSRAACDVTGGSGAVQVGLDTGLVQVVL